ncbi:MaoC family dehydratase N-terminal domain-containing protein [Geobacillus thermodenitrificans]|uniref:MaoC family dehydratase N-terminal domain-containing protein n=1 Tax=Geobacillus TaxID=129337 RepID=UPI00017E6F07|nr:MaoC family dehydratase N-terminal domain-containing protein [Geobacillus sp. PA-3]KQB93440.1 MaoC family dehydratase [Geobacillus sp. PA-3]
MYQDDIGKRSEKVKNVVERGAVKKFAEAIGDLNPIYWDEETGKRSRYGRNIAPPTFPRVFDYGVIEGLKLPPKGLIHGEQRFRYERPLFVGEELYCYAEVKDYYEKQSSMGQLGFLIIANNGEDTNGNLLFTSTSTIIINEAIRKAMSV